jgi:hypothetical protein
MGGCASAPAVKDGRATHALQSTPPATAALPVVHLSPPPSARDTVKQAPPQPPLEDFALEGRVGSITVKRLRTGSSQTKLQMQFLTEVGHPRAARVTHARHPRAAAGGPARHPGSAGPD